MWPPLPSPLMDVSSPFLQAESRWVLWTAPPSWSRWLRCIWWRRSRGRRRRCACQRWRSPGWSRGQMWPNQRSQRREGQEEWLSDTYLKLCAACKLRCLNSSIDFLFLPQSVKSRFLWGELSDWSSSSVHSSLLGGLWPNNRFRQLTSWALLFLCRKLIKRNVLLHKRLVCDREYVTTMKMKNLSNVSSLIQKYVEWRYASCVKLCITPRAIQSSYWYNRDSDLYKDFTQGLKLPIRVHVTATSREGERPSSLAVNWQSKGE